VTRLAAIAGGWRRRPPVSGTRAIARLLAARDGVTAMEFGLIATAVVVTIATFLPGMSTRLSSMFSAVSTSL